MKIIFFGTSKFAVASLKRLKETKHDVILVVTQPDREKGRNLEVSSPPIKDEARKLGLTLYQTDDLSKSSSIEMLKKKEADLFIVVAFGQILKKELLDLPKLYSINLHASLLPKYRGAAPINWAIINGDKSTGVSVIKINEKMDAGDIILEKKVEILPTDTSESLALRLSKIGSNVLIEAIYDIKKGDIKFTKQDEKLATSAPKLKKEDGLIDWKKPADQIHNLVKGLIPWPGAYTSWNGNLVKIWKTDLDVRDFEQKPGQLAEVTQESIVVKTGTGNLVIKELQLEGKKRLDTASFLRGNKLIVGDKLG